MNLQDFLTSTAQDLGTTEDTAKSAAGGLLSFVKDKADPGDFQSLLSQMPGASDLLGAAPNGGSGGGGLLGAVGKLAGGLTGGGGASGLLGMIAQSGLSLDDAGSFVSKFLGFAKDNVAGDLLDKILGQIPDLKSLVK